LVIEGINFWLSSRDLPDGRRWASELSEHLEASDFGILVVTPINLSSPWLLFEAGALSKDIESGRVIPYLVAVGKDELVGPLGQFQALSADKAGTLRLVKAICSALQASPDATVIQKRFDAFWPELNHSLDEITSLIETKKELHTRNLSRQANGEDTVAILRKELADTTNLIRQLVNHWNPSLASGEAIRTPSDPESLKSLEGAWLAHEDNTHMYIRVINGTLVAPYCYDGNDALTAEHYAWRKTGDFWFTRYRWFTSRTGGFAFYKLESTNRLVGTWWYDEDSPREISTYEALDKKTRERGIQGTWTRRADFRLPTWAEEYFAKIEQQGKRPT
jgi:hypothetical protein